MEERAPPYGYRAYGLAIRSDLPLPELDSDPAVMPDLTIRLGSAGRTLPQSPSETVYEFGPDTHYLAWPGVGAFLIKGTHTIVIEPDPGVSPRLLNLPLLGPVIALVLHLRGMHVLHASAVDVHNRAAAFLGDKGAGKSTTAAAFVAAGHRLLADDVLAITMSGAGRPGIVPGFPQMKLKQEAADCLALEGTVAMPLPIPNFPKQQRRLTGSFSHALVPPQRVYVLNRGSSAKIMPLSPPEALSALLSFSFATLFLLHNNALDNAAASRQLAQCAALASVVQVARLEVPSDLKRLSEIVPLVENDLA